MRYTFEDIRYWLRGIGLVAIAAGAGVATSVGNPPAAKVAIYERAAAHRVAASTGLFREAAIYVCVGGVFLTAVSFLPPPSGKRW